MRRVNESISWHGEFDQLRERSGLENFIDRINFKPVLLPKEYWKRQ